MNISELRSFCGSDWDKVNARIGEALKSDDIKFLASDNWNNEYAFGSGNVRNEDMAVSAGQTVTPIYGGQGNCRYAMFSIPAGINYIEVCIGDASEDENENALGKDYEFKTGYARFESR